MRAFLSDPDKRSRWLEYMKTHYTATVEETGVTPEDWVLNMALAEARTILADAEPVDYAWYRMRAHHATGWGSLEALAESLRSFVEGN